VIAALTVVTLQWALAFDASGASLTGSRLQSAPVRYLTESLRWSRFVHGTTFFAPGFELVVPTESTAANPKTIERTFIPTPEGMIGVLTRSATGSRNAAESVTFKTDYWHKDHLGSLVASTNESGTITQRFTFDPWGKRVCLAANGTTSTCSSNGSTGTEERGFTGHEMLDEIGLIHMNGRLYDPELGRFLQADPVIQNPLDGQNYNRYSYVGNNPLSYTDPSGFSRWTKWRAPLFGLVAAIAVPWAVSELILANASGGSALLLQSEAIFAPTLSSTGQAVANVAGGMAAGGVSGGNVQSAVIGAVTAGLQFGVGQSLGHGTPSVFSGGAGTVTALQKMAAHAAIGCASAAASGGSCKAGAASAGFSSLAGGSLPGANNLLGRAVIGAVASKLAGGKAEQGALLAAMEGLYNECGATANCGWRGGYDPSDRSIGTKIAQSAGMSSNVGEVIDIGLPNILGGLAGNWLTNLAGRLSLRFSQTTASAAFQEGGALEGRTIGQVVDALRVGELSAKNLPVQYVTVDGNNLIVNTRSALALTRAGIPQSEWIVLQNQAALPDIMARLTANSLTVQGTATIRITGMGKSASDLR